MIRLFAQLRKKALTSGNTTKYLPYALGEVILVVIGILIAVSINGVNENRKERREEQRLIANFHSDIAADINQLENIINQSQNFKGQIDSIFAILQNPSTEKTFEFLRYQIAVVNENYFTPNTGTFDEATSAGRMTFIRSDHLRQSLFKYYKEAGYKRVDDAAFQFSTRIGIPTLLRQLAVTREGLQGLGYDLEQLPSLDLKKMAKNQDYLAMLSGKVSIHSNQIDAWQTKKAEAEKLIADLMQKE